ncbi:S49 family peptidase [Flavobacterium beibuense]|uniref:S49 family peptidase n=1 Tax=Flavobacterium beibuense TaxID=657326 RepID=UPI003A91B765
MNIENLLKSNFYIHEGYALSYAAAVYRTLVDVSFIQKDQLELIDECTNLSSYEDESGEAKNVAIITFNQPVIKYDYYYWLGTQTYIKILEQYRTDSSVAGVVFNMDTGGGQVYGTPEFHDYIIEFVESKPFVVYCGGYLCSGGYYIAAPASWIVVNKRADAIGSIGAYSQIFDDTGIWEKFGAKVHTIYATESTEKNAAYRDVLEKGDYKRYIKEELDPIVKTFQDDMRSSRPQLNEEVFKGGTWPGTKAVEMGLADEVGTLATAIAKVYELSGVSGENNNNSKKSKKMSKKKSYPNVQKVLGVEGEGISIVKKTISGKQGVFIEEEQLDAIEADMVAKATAVTEANEKATAAEGKVKAIETAVVKAVETSGLEDELEDDATAEQMISALGNKVVEYGSKPGAQTANPKSDGDKFDADADDQDKSTSIINSI